MRNSKTSFFHAAAVASLGTVLAAALVPSLAVAGDYGSYRDQRGYYYEPCQRDTTQRGTTGALTGAALGAAIGSSVASRGTRTEGAVLGGILGAVAGASVGRNSAACSPTNRDQAYYGNGQYGYGQGYQGHQSQGYYSRQHPGSRYSYGDGYYQGGYSQPAPAYGYGYEQSYVNQGGGADGCTLAESPIYLPDGRVQKRFVRVCRDSSGRYQIVE